MELAGESYMYQDVYRWHSALFRTLNELRATFSLQTHFRLMTAHYLDAQSKKALSGNKLLREIQTFYREYQGFTWKTTTTFAIIRNGHLDRNVLIELRGSETGEELPPFISRVIQLELN